MNILDNLRFFYFVDSMILLGSIQRSELITLIDEHLGKDRRSKIIGKWKIAADK